MLILAVDRTPMDGQQVNKGEEVLSFGASYLLLS